MHFLLALWLAFSALFLFSSLSLSPSFIPLLSFFQFLFLLSCSSLLPSLLLPPLPPFLLFSLPPSLPLSLPLPPSPSLFLPSLPDTLDDDDEVLWALAEQLGDKDFVVFVGGPEYAYTLLVSTVVLHFLKTCSFQTYVAYCTVDD